MCNEEPERRSSFEARRYAGIDPDFSDWMAALSDDVPLSSISMPGTHNSASFAITRQLSTLVTASRCQSCSLETQLQMGVRFIDLRVRPDGQLCHGPVSCEMSLQQALEDVSRFLEAHPSEVVLARIKDEGARVKSALAVDKLVHRLVESAEFPVYLQMRLPLLHEVRGRIVILGDWAHGQLGVKWGGEHMLIQDQYWHRTGRMKWGVVRRHLQYCTAPLPDCLQVHFTSATSLPRKTPIAMARSVNPKLRNYLRANPRRRFLGAVLMDFPAPLLCDVIIRHNWRSLDPCRSVVSLVEASHQRREWLDNLSCELMAASSRADAMALSQHEELRPGVQWLSRVYSKLLIERAVADIAEPVVQDRTLPLLDSNHVQSSSSSSTLAATQPQQTKKAETEQLSAKGGLLSRFGLRRKRIVRKRPECDATPSPKAPAREENVPQLVFVTNASDSLLEDLGCELIAAASRADAAEMMQPEELPMRVKCVSRLLVRVLVRQAQLGETAPVFLTAPGSETVASFVQDDADAGVSDSSEGLATDVETESEAEMEGADRFKRQVSESDPECLRHAGSRSRLASPPVRETPPQSCPGSPLLQYRQSAPLTSRPVRILKGFTRCWSAGVGSLSQRKSSG